MFPAESAQSHTHRKHVQPPLLWLVCKKIETRMDASNQTGLCIQNIFVFFLLQVMVRKYQQEHGISLPITFGDDHIALDIPDDGAQTDNGWIIVPLQKALVSYKIVMYVLS